MMGRISSPILLGLLLGTVAPLVGAGPGQAFEIFCVPGGDGTLSCQRLDDADGAILCVDSASGIRTCTNPDGEVSTCVRTRGNVFSCSGAGGSGTDATSCQPTGDGTWVCDPAEETLPDAVDGRAEPGLNDPATIVPGITEPEIPQPDITAPTLPGDLEFFP